MANRVIGVIPAKRWRHKTTGRTVSPYGACPWWSEAERQDWTLEVVGWTWACSDGTVGLCRKPAATREEAVAYMISVNGPPHLRH